MKTVVVNIKYENYDVYIGRPSKWGNPYSHNRGTLAKFVVENVDESLEKYEKHIRDNEELFNSLHELEGKRIGCFCKPGKCHGDILVKLINEKNNILQHI